MEISEELGIKVMPTTLIINKDMQEVSRVTGYIDWKSKKIIDTIKELL